MNTDPSDQKNELWIKVGRYMGMTVSLPAAAFVGYAIGYGLDHLFGTRFFRLIFLVLGVAAGLIQVVRELNRER